MLKAISSKLFNRSFAFSPLYLFSRKIGKNNQNAEVKMDEGQKGGSTSTKQKTEESEKKKTEEQKIRQQQKKRHLKFISKFTDLKLLQDKQKKITTGRSWRASELRIKSNQDLHKLWYVCVREKNLVLADQMVRQHDYSYVRKAGKIRRLEKLQQTQRRILHVMSEREKIRKQYRKQLEEQYIQKKKAQLQSLVSKQPQPLPQITFQMLRGKYHALKLGIDNTDYLDLIFKKKEKAIQRQQRAEQRMAKFDYNKKFESFLNYELTIGQRPTQNEILSAHIKNWKSLNLKQRKIILGFLNARRSKDAKQLFVKELKILGQQIAYQEAKQRNESSLSK